MIETVLIRGGCSKVERGNTIILRYLLPEFPQSDIRIHCSQNHNLKQQQKLHHDQFLRQATVLGWVGPNFLS